MTLLTSSHDNLSKFNVSLLKIHEIKMHILYVNKFDRKNFKFNSF